MKTKFSLILIILFSLVLVYSCATVPMTGRSQLSLIPDDQILGMSFQQYDEFLSQNELSNNKDMAEMVTRVGTQDPKIS